VSVWLRSPQCGAAGETDSIVAAEEAMPFGEVTAP
jgi:hypothetical protein